jgi:hypothetical protein
MNIRDSFHAKSMAVSAAIRHTAIRRLLGAGSEIDAEWNKKRLEEEKETHHATQRFTERRKDSFPQ